MEKIVETVSGSKITEYDMVTKYFGDKTVMMFDIETTGLSPISSFTYIIGVNIYKDGNWQIIQLFNDDGKSEPDMIREFHSIIAEADVLIEFNGDTFDIPYIRKRMDTIEKKFHISLTDNFGDLEPYDLLKMIRKYKFALGLPNVKQKTVEKYLGIDRVDMYNGGQLIDVYLGYLGARDEKSRKLVLRHNRDDMEGMIFLSSILSIEAMCEGYLSVNDIKTESKMKHSGDSNSLSLVVECKLDYPLIKPICTMGCGIDFDAERDVASVRIPILTDKHRFYYGCDEKSGYEEREGYFVPALCISDLSDMIPCYKDKARDKKGYVMLNDEFLGNPDFVKKYVASVIGQVMADRGKR
ncbi:MAG: ribonuclease H-like domain-containing protein [Eubacterium sp.]|nr:ribonuclease H-like domain-containing protein [Eubacterium sp.]